MSLEQILDNKYVSTAMVLVLGLYSTLLGPKLPTPIKSLFNNTIFRILVLFFIVVRANKDPKVAILTAIAFILTLDYIYLQDAKDTFKNVDKLKKKYI